MAQLKFGSAGVTSREIDISGPTTQQPSGIPAGIIGTAQTGPAFVPITVGNLSDWYSKFGTTDGKKFGPLAVLEWLRNSRSVTYLRVLGVGDGRMRDNTTGKVARAGFVVGAEQPNDTNGYISENPYANQSRAFGGSPGSSAVSATATITTSAINENAGIAPGGDESRGFSLIDSFNNEVRILIDPTGGLGQTPHGFAELSSGAGGSNGVYRIFVGTNGGATANAFAQQIEDALTTYLTTELGLLGGGQIWDCTVSRLGNVITVTQGTGGVAGNTVHNEYDLPTIDNALSVTDFTGGVDAVAPVPATTYFAELGRTFFLGCFMSESVGSTIFSDAGLQKVGQNVATPIIRGVLMTPSGVLAKLSSSVGTGGSNDVPAVTTVGTEVDAKGHVVGSAVLSANGSPKQEFIVFLNGHKGTDPAFPNVLTASFDPLSNNYFAKTFNTDPHKYQEAGHFLYANWDIHPTLAVVTGAGVVAAANGAAPNGGKEPAAFLVSSSLGSNTGSTTVPNYETFEDRFGHAVSPWVTSQKFGGKSQNLFRLHALDDGAGISTKYKIAIENIVPSNDPLNKFGSFNVVLREWTDRDLDKKNLPNEVFAGVNLDPSSDNYIGKKIGDVHAYFEFDREEDSQKIVVEGDYPNRSNFVRVEVHPDVVNGFVDPVSLPMGFRGVDHLVTSGSTPMAALGTADAAVMVGTNANVLKKITTPPLPFRGKVTLGKEWDPKEIVETKLYWGVQFEHPETLEKKNSSVLRNDSLKAFAKYFPKFSLDSATFVTGSNEGQPDTVEFGILDADRFCNNGFSLENVQVVTGSNGLADPTKWNKAMYVRTGNPGAYGLSKFGTSDDKNKLRGFKVEDIPNSKQFAKFTMLMQGGFDGVNIFDEDSEAINNNAVNADMMSGAGRGLNDGPNVRTYIKALDIMKNTVNLDIQLLAIPGIRHEIVTDAATLAVEERFDAMFLMDVQQFDENGEIVSGEETLPSVTQTLTQFQNRAVDTSFAAAYFPDVLYKDPQGNNLQVPPSVLVLGALALNDAVGYPWFAPAGFTRGALPDAALEPRVRLNQGDMDKLYDNSINPIVAFPGSAKSGTNPKGGIVVWGQKTLQVAASALDRVNVRRLLIDIRRQVRDIAQTILFEPNREATLARFSAAVTPRLQRIQALSGLERFKVVIDSSTTTQDDILNNTIRGKIFVQPTKSIEFVSLDFVVANNLTQVQ